MSEKNGTLRAHADASPTPSDAGESLAPRSIGEYLKRQRLLRGIEIEDLAASTRIPLRSLERLEAGYFDGVSDGFVRGFVRTVSLALGLDADQTVARMLDEPATGRWERNGTGLWRKQALAMGALVAATLLGLFVLRAGWNLLVDGGSGSGREVVVWRDPVHQLAREAARAPAAPAQSPASVESVESAESADFAEPEESPELAEPGGAG